MLLGLSSPTLRGSDRAQMRRKDTQKKHFYKKLDVIAAHLLPLTNYLANGQYALVQPIDSKFAERCICTTLTPSNLAWERGDSAQ